MTDAEIRKAVDEFVALPRKEREAKYFSLPKEVRVRARRVIEARRGIAFRNEGIPVHTKDGFIKQLVRQSVKLAELPKRMEGLKSNLVGLKRDLQETYGDEALAEAENAIEEALASLNGSEEGAADNA